MQFFRFFLYILTFVALYRNIAAYFYTENECMKVVRQDEKVDLNQLSGTWYEFSKYPSSITLGNNCTSYNIEVTSDNAFDLTIFNRKYGIDYILNGTGTLTEDGVLAVHYDQSLGSWQNMEHSIVEIDYENYLILFSCMRESPKTNHYINLVWVLTRQRIPDKEFKSNLALILTKHQISLAPLFRTKQRNCPSPSVPESFGEDVTETETETEKNDSTTNENESTTITTECEGESTSTQNSEEIPHTHLNFETIISNLNDSYENESEE